LELINHERLQTYDPDVRGRAIDYASLERAETIHQALAKSDYIHGTGDSVRQGKYKTYGSSELRSQWSGNHIICATCKKRENMFRLTFRLTVLPSRQICRDTYVQTFINQDIN